MNHLIKFVLLGILLSSNVFSQAGIPKVYVQLHNNRQIAHINRETKILADMRIENANGSNYPDAQLFDNWIRIRGRGNSSWGECQKRSYSIDLVDNQDRRVNVPLLGMPRESNFILYSSCLDKSFLRNYFSYHLATAMGHWASRNRFVELYINGEYRGLYVVAENIRMGADRMNVGTGGFILEQDYPQRLESVDFITSARQYEGRLYKDPPRTTDNLYFAFQYPSDGDRTSAQTDYIRDYIHAFEAALFAGNFADPIEGYRKYIDVNTFVDWYIISELGADYDHCEFLSSCYISKPEGGKLQMMPVWDFDVGFKHNSGNPDIYARRYVPWINRMWDDLTFRQLVFARYAEIVLILEDAIEHIEDMAEQLNYHGAVDRNYERWDILGKHIWAERPPPIPSTYAGEIRRLTQRIRHHFLRIATDSNSNFCDILENMKPAIRILDQDIYENGQLNMEVETNTFNTGVSNLTTSYIWNNVSGNNRQYTINNYGEHTLSIRMSTPSRTCESQTAVLHVKELATVSIAGTLFEYDYTPKNVTVTTNPPGLEVLVTYNGKTDKPVMPGLYRVVAEIVDNRFKGKAVSTIEIKLNDSMDASLQSLTVNNGTLMPAFSPSHTEYTVYLNTGTSSINVTGIATQPEATVQGNVTNHPVDVGQNEINITVTAFDNVTTLTYRVNVIRAGIARKIFINEISGNQKWLELYNDEDEAIDISGYILQRRRNTGEIDNWSIPAGTIISAKSYITWQEGTDPNVTFTWGITAQRDVAFRLFDNHHQELDYFEVRMLDNLYSWDDAATIAATGGRTVGRETDGNPKLVVFLNGGTRGSSNNAGIPEPQPTGIGRRIFINEISGNDKWLEIYNDENVDVNLTGYVIRKIDDVNEATNWTIPAGTIIPAKGFLAWTQNVGNGFTWGITAQRDVCFKIFDDERRELDFFEVRMSNGLFSQGSNRTVGRQTDGHPHLIIFRNSGTRGSSNNAGIPDASTPIVAINDATLRRLTVENGTLSPVFTPQTTSYTVILPDEITTITVTGVATNTAASVSGNVSDMPFENDEITINITVTAEDGISRQTYTIKIMRESSAEITVAESLLASEEQLIVYPNPFTGVINIVVETMQTPFLQVFNAAGTVVHAQWITNQPESISLEHLPAGLYILRFEKDGEVKTMRVIKVN